MIGHSFLNDGPRFHGLSPAIVHMRLHADEDAVTIDLEDVPDLDFRTTIQIVKTYKLLKAFVCNMFLFFSKCNGCLCCNVIWLENIH